MDLHPQKIVFMLATIILRVGMLSGKQIAQILQWIRRLCGGYNKGY